MKWHRVLVPAALAAAAFLRAHEGHGEVALKGVRFTGNRIEMEPRTARALGLESSVARATTAEGVFVVNGVASLAPRAQAWAGAALPGVVLEVLVSPGARVVRGDVLARLDSPELERLTLQWKQSLGDLATARAEAGRARSAGTVVPLQDREALDAAVSERELAAESLRGRLRAAGLDEPAIEALGNDGTPGRVIPVIAPLDGIVVHVDVTAGEPIHHDRHLFEIADDSETWVEAQVPEAFAAEAVPGRQVRVVFDGVPGIVHRGTLVRPDARIDERSRTLRIHARLDGVRVARPGAPGRVEIIATSAAASLVPAGAVVRRGLDRIVFVAAEDGSWEPRLVRAGANHGSDIEILSGVAPGERVMTSGAHPLSTVFASGALSISAEERRSHDIRTAEVEFRAIEDVVRMPATLRIPQGRSAWVAAPVGGRIRALVALPGDTVAAGGALAELEAPELRDEQADLILAEERLALLERRAATLRGLEGRGVSVLRERVRLEAEARQERLKSSSLRARIVAAGLPEQELSAAVAGRLPRETVILRAPIAGIVAVSGAIPGQFVEARDRLFEIVDTSVLHAEGFLGPTDAWRLPLDRQAETVLRPVAWRDLAWPGVLLRIAPGVEESGVLRVWSEARNPGGQLRPGMTAELAAVVSSGGERVITAPAEALWPSGGNWYVFLEDGEGFRRQRVTPGRRGSRSVEIRQGLYPGDRVAVSGLDELDVALGALR